MNSAAYKKFITNLPSASKVRDFVCLSNVRKKLHELYKYETNLYLSKAVLTSLHDGISSILVKDIYGSDGACLEVQSPT